MNELLTWLATLDPVFAFLLALPFLVAAAGGLAEGVRYFRDRRSQEAGDSQREDARLDQAQSRRARARKPSYGL